jgi:hypothetical protein
MSCIPALWHAWVAGRGWPTSTGANLRHSKSTGWRPRGWERKGLSLDTVRALANAGFLTVDDLHSAHDLELEAIPRVVPRASPFCTG